MNNLSSLLRFVRKIQNHSDSNIGELGNSIPIDGTFYIDSIELDGAARDQRIDAKYLTEKKGDFFIYGWWQMVPCFRAVRVDQILLLADQKSGQLVPKDDVLSWLLHRAAK
jgi:hypothetical protein